MKSKHLSVKCFDVKVAVLRFAIVENLLSAFSLFLLVLQDCLL